MVLSALHLKILFGIYIYIYIYIIGEVDPFQLTTPFELDCTTLSAFTSDTITAVFFQVVLLSFYNKHCE